MLPYFGIWNLCTLLLLICLLGRVNTRLHRNALVILGQKLHANSTAPRNLHLRLEQGVVEMLKNNCTCVVLSGRGEDSTEIPEARVMSETFISLLQQCDDETKEDIENLLPVFIEETESKNTIEVVLFVLVNICNFYLP